MTHKINISIDDITPHPRSSIKVVKRCLELIEIFPNIKFSLFIPVAYWQTMPRRQMITSTKEPLRIDEHPTFCEILKSLPENNFEFCYHGYYHGIPHKSNNDEFQYLNEADAIEKFNSMFEVVADAGLSHKFKKIFRPPAWRMSPESFKASKKVGIEILALSPDAYAMETYKGEQDNFDKVVYYNVNPPFKELKLFEKTEIVYHACEWDKNFLDHQKTKDLSNFLLKNPSEYEFCFFEEML